MRCTLVLQKWCWTSASLTSLYCIHENFCSGLGFRSGVNNHHMHLFFDWYYNSVAMTECNWVDFMSKWEYGRICIHNRKEKPIEATKEFTTWYYHHYISYIYRMNANTSTSFLCTNKTIFWSQKLIIIQSLRECLYSMDTLLLPLLVDIFTSSNKHSVSYQFNLIIIADGLESMSFDNVSGVPSFAGWIFLLVSMVLIAYFICGNILLIHFTFMIDYEWISVIVSVFKWNHVIFHGS